MKSATKINTLLILLCALTTLAVSCKNSDNAPKAETAAGKSAEASPGSTEFKSEKEKISYILGYGTGKTIINQNIDLADEIFIRGLKDGIKNPKESPLFKEAEMRTIIQTYQASRMKKMREEMEAKGKKNQEAGEKFLADNKKKSDVVTLPSGLQYKVLVAGNGAKPSSEDTVNVEYKGTLLDGTVFDTTEGKAQPASMSVKVGIPGWQEALKLMPVGSKWEVYVPSHLAYGPNGAGGKIGPNETLKFEVKLLAIQKNEKPATNNNKAAKPVEVKKPS
jgi:FKBP-type peptidyl-prolyl cis-trans isomerase FklB